MAILFNGIKTELHNTVPSKQHQNSIFNMYVRGLSTNKQASSWTRTFPIYNSVQHRMTMTSFPNPSLVFH